MGREEAEVHSPYIINYINGILENRIVTGTRTFYPRLDNILRYAVSKEDA
jgi:hypothetical protein